MRRAFWLTLTVAPYGATIACVLWVLAHSPFTTPFAERTALQIEAELTRLMARNVTVEWLVPRMEEAIAQKDLIDIEMLVDLAIEYEVAIPPDLKDQLQDTVEAESGIIATARACGRCAIDIGSCRSVAAFGACGVTFELTPGGDLNAIRRGALAYVEGEDVDQLDLGLALVGLGATGAVIATGGSSYSAKVGASFLRIARRVGTMTPALTRQVADLVTDAVRWDRMGDFTRFRVAPADMVDMTKLADLAGLGGSIRRISANTGIADSLSLMRQIDNADDAARVARVSDIMGPSTRGTFEVLGKARVFRAMVRLSDIAFGAAVAVYVMILQIAALLAQQGGNMGLRMLRRRLRRS